MKGLLLGSYHLLHKELNCFKELLSFLWCHLEDVESLSCGSGFYAMHVHCHRPVGVCRIFLCFQEVQIQKCE